LVGEIRNTRFVADGKSAKLKEMTYTTPVLAKVVMAGIEFWQHDAEYNVLDKNPAVFGDRQFTAPTETGHNKKQLCRRR